MDWNLKAPSWDLSEFEQESIHNTNTVDSSSSYGDHRIREEFSIDLKLGRVGNSVENSVMKLKEPGDLKMAASPSGSSKRARAASNVNQTFCLVDGCTSDLSNCREYHRRHKVCELHSKTPQVTIGGQKQRFCQQCSRFHSLDEFDEGKRSCRKRLDGHNRRRRKPQPEPLSHSGRFFPNYQGSQLLPFSSSHIFPSTTVVNPTWSGVVNTEDLGIYSHCQQLNLLDKQNVLLGSSANSYNREKQFTFLQGDNILNRQTSPGASSRQQLLKPIALSESGSRGHSMFCDALKAQVYDSSCALSLLSSPQTQTSGIRLSHMVQPNSIPLVQPLGPSLHHSSLEPVDAVLVSSASTADMRCQGMFQIGSDGSSGNQPPQSLPFHWQ